jgi:hypothetical protein
MESEFLRFDKHVTQIAKDRNGNDENKCHGIKFFQSILRIDKTRQSQGNREGSLIMSFLFSYKVEKHHPMVMP